MLAHGHGRLEVRLVDAPWAGRPVTVVWRKRRWICPESSCPRVSFVEQDERIARPRVLLTVRACRWAIEQIRREHTSIHGLARQLGTTWDTVWASVRPLLEHAAADESRFAGVTTLGVDEHVWHHVNPIKRGPKELTGMVDLTRQPHPKNPGKTVVKARLLDLVVGRSGPAYAGWLKQRGEVAALAVALHLQKATGSSIKKIVRTLRPLQLTTLTIGGHELTATGPLTEAAREIIAATGTNWPTH